ncbi:MAG: DNA polymerase III [Treponema sp.]|jgi:DNA polymerase-3 subunit gamma/tau|nr:DNA polymerase III [Treponema sp.]
MFENIIAQAATVQLGSDVLSGRIAPSMLFFGPPASGKGSAAIELARSLSCEAGAAQWNCICPSCVRHRSLLHPDLAMLGPRAFSAEIAASRAAFLRDTSSTAGRSLFVRSLRKLLARFAPSVWEYESKSGRTNPLSLLQSLEEDLDELEASASPEKIATLEKLCDSLANNAFKLEDECVSDAIPIAQIRKAAYWSRLSPSGRRKTLIIENADRMKDEARNSLLKLLEEPPETISIVLTAQRRESVLPTILSRLRPYRFVTRSADEEREIIRRIFRDPQAAAEGKGVAAKNTSRGAAAGLVESYLNSFLPQPSEKLVPLAAFFVAAVARSAAVLAKGKGTAAITPALSALGSYCAPIAEAAGFERLMDAKAVVGALLSRSGNFEGRSFSRFLALSLDLVSWSLEQCSAGPDSIACREIWKKRIADAQAAYGVWNQRPESSLESLFCRLREDMA